MFGGPEAITYEAYVERFNKQSGTCPCGASLLRGYDAGRDEWDPSVHVDEGGTLRCCRCAGEACRCELTHPDARVLDLR